MDVFGELVMNANIFGRNISQGYVKYSFGHHYRTICESEAANSLLFYNNICTKLVYGSDNCE